MTVWILLAAGALCLALAGALYLLARRLGWDFMDRPAQKPEGRGELVASAVRAASAARGRLDSKAGRAVVRMKSAAVKSDPKAIANGVKAWLAEDEGDKLIK